MFCPTRSSTRITRASQTSQEWLRLPKVFRLTGDCCQQDLSEVFEDSCGRLMLQASLRKAAARAMRFICRGIFFLRLYIYFCCVYICIMQYRWDRLRVCRNTASSTLWIFLFGLLHLMDLQMVETIIVVFPFPKQKTRHHKLATLAVVLY
jgi:hypothetical protein